MASCKNIVFFTTSLEHGKNGVGDYTYTLGTLLVNLGVKIKIIALHDPFIDSVSEGISNDIEQLRLPRNITDKEKIRISKEWLGDAKVDWFSLQLVAYGYHSKGTFYSVGNMVKQIIGHGYLQIFLHELWPGAFGVTSTKQKLWSAIQKHSFFSLMEKTLPRLLHTSIPIYREYLESKNLIADTIPLPSNVPFTEDDGTLPITLAENSVMVVFFATIYENFDFDACFDFLSKHFSSKISIIHIGNMKTTPPRFSNALNKFSDKINFQTIPGLSDREINQVFYRADLGINTTPAVGIGKSSSYTAMRQTGLPVLAQMGELPIDPDTMNSLYPNVIVQEKENPTTLSLNNFRYPPTDNNPDIAKNFLSKLTSYEF